PSTSTRMRVGSVSWVYATDARRVRSGKMGSNRSPDDYLALAERLERFLAELPG
ncbi:SMI1/KNR4 family protein, partial [Pseudomonas aeruginosa]|nr:SMI1/KNR4 family protein [Pseudomonas aeruginosa]